MNNFLELDAFSVIQPFQEFYVCAINADKLLDIVYTDPIRYDKEGKLVGIQRTLDEKKRVKEIKEFVEGVDSAFPNSIILSANWDEDGFNIENEKLRWKFDRERNKLIIPTRERLASVIDGQHRLYGFKDANEEARKMQLLCSVYIDLPNSLQAYLFATINSTQKKVDKSLAYEQFGYNIDFEPPESWSPDKLAIALYKKFNTESGPFYRHIKMAPQVDDAILLAIKESGWAVSNATIVDGILRMISSNPKRDKYLLQQIPIKERKRSLLNPDNKRSRELFPFLNKDKSPLRELYLNVEDIVIYKIIYNFFEAAFESLDLTNPSKSILTKTIGIQGLFDALKKVLEADISNVNGDLEQVNFKKQYYIEKFKRIINVDLGEDFFARFSNIGRSQITDVFLLANGYISSISKQDMSDREKTRFEYLAKLQEFIKKN